MAEKASILIVDDNADICSIMSLILKFQGYTVTTASNGLEATEKVREHPFDAIFMDIMMPIMDGVKSCKIIKKMRPEAVVVMMTAYAVEDLVQEALREGACDVFYKPVDIDKMVDLIEGLRAKKQRACFPAVDGAPDG